MQKTAYILLLTAITCLLCGCTHMNGDIGDLFGRWNLTSLTVDGEEQTLYSDASQDGDVLLYTWAFQGDIVTIQTLYHHQNYHTVRGMWRRDRENLVLDFSFSDDSGTINYRPPKELHFNDGGVTSMEIRDESSSKLTLSHVSEDGVEYVYYLKKAY